MYHSLSSRLWLAKSFEICRIWVISFEIKKNVVEVCVFSCMSLVNFYNILTKTFTFCIEVCYIYEEKKNKIIEKRAS